MKALDEIATLVSAMQQREGKMMTFEELLGEISVCMTDILAIMERPEEPEDDGPMLAAINSITTALKSIGPSLKALSITAPDVIVNVAAPPAPPPAEVNVTVQPAQVVVMPSPERQMAGWTMQVTQRDGNGAIRAASFKPL